MDRTFVPPLLHFEASAYDLTPMYPSTAAGFVQLAQEQLRRALLVKNLTKTEVRPDLENWLTRVWAKYLYRYYAFDALVYRVKAPLQDNVITESNLFASEKWRVLHNYVPGTRAVPEFNHYLATTGRATVYSGPSLAVGVGLQLKNIPFEIPVRMRGCLSEYAGPVRLNEMVERVATDSVFVANLVGYFLTDKGRKVRDLLRIDVGDMLERVYTWRRDNLKQMERTTRRHAPPDWVFKFRFNSVYHAYELRSVDDFVKEGMWQRHCLGKNHHELRGRQGCRFFSLRKAYQTKAEVTLTLCPVAGTGDNTVYRIVEGHTFANAKNYANSADVRSLVHVAFAANPSVKVRLEPRLLT
jgi:hypothetical protein